MTIETTKVGGQTKDQKLKTDINNYTVLKKLEGNKTSFDNLLSGDKLKTEEGRWGLFKEINNDLIEQLSNKKKVEVIR